VWEETVRGVEEWHERLEEEKGEDGRTEVLNFEHVTAALAMKVC
jgi:hypothetical protein